MTRKLIIIIIAFLFIVALSFYSSWKSTVERDREFQRLFKIEEQIKLNSERLERRLHRLEAERPFHWK